MLNNRLDKVRSICALNGIDCFLVGSPTNRRYLSGFTGSAGWLIISHDHAALAVDFRYVEQAKVEASHFKIHYVKSDFIKWLIALLQERRLNRVGIESEHITHSFYQQLERSCNNGAERIGLFPQKNVVESLRLKKEPAELECIMKACDIADQAIMRTLPAIKAGMTEREVAWLLENSARQLGSEPLPFDIIVASGPNSALPHHRPDNRLLVRGEPIIIDMGARYNGYCSDMTRTYIIGKEDASFNKIYNVVMAAQATVLSMLKTDMSTTDADNLARKIIDTAGHGEQFGHGLGHGIGLDPHEQPRLGLNSDGLIEEGMVFTVEPGIYIPGWGGIRIEDTVAVINEKLVQLTKASKMACIQGG